GARALGVWRGGWEGRKHPSPRVWGMARGAPRGPFPAVGGGRPPRPPARAAGRRSRDRRHVAPRLARGAVMTHRLSPWVVPGAILAAGLAIYPAIAQQTAPLVAGLGGLAFVLFVAGQTLPVPGALAWSLGLLGIEYLATLKLRGAA